MTDATQKIDNLRITDPQMSAMVERTRAQPHRENLDQLRQWYGGKLPPDEQYDYTSAFEDGMLDMEKIATYQQPQELEPGEEMNQRPFDFLPNEYWRDNKWGRSTKQFELTTGTHQYTHSLDRVIMTGLQEAGKGIIDFATDVGARTWGAQAGLDLNVADDMLDELEQGLFNQYATNKVNAGNGLAGAAEYMGAEMAEMLGYYMLTRRVVPQSAQLKSAPVSMDAARFGRAMTRIGNGLKAGFSPETILAEVLYAQNDDNVPMTTASGLRSIGLNGPLVDALEGADEETQRFIGNMVDGIVFMEALRYAGLGGKWLAQSTHNRVKGFVQPRLEQARRELDTLKRVLPYSVSGVPAAPRLDESVAARQQRASEQGYTQEGFHGSTHDIESFDGTKANPDNDWGQGTYISNSEDDVSINYAGEGPDLTSRIEREAERIADEIGEEYDSPKALAEARKRLIGDAPGGVVYPVVVKTDEFAVIGGARPTYHQGTDYMEEAKYNVDRADFDDEDDYLMALEDEAMELADSDVHGLYVQVSDALKRILPMDQEDEINAVMDDLVDEIASNEMSLTELDKAIRKHVTFAETDEGDVMPAGAVVAYVLQRLGYKGVIDHTVDQKFGSQRRMGKSMEGMNPDTQHIVVFPGNENLIRSKNANFDPAKAGSRNIMAGFSGAAVAAGLAGERDE